MNEAERTPPRTRPSREPGGRAGERRPRVDLTAEGAVALTSTAAFAGAALYLGDNLVFLMGSLILGCGLVCRRLARKNLADVEVTRTLPDRTRVGVPTALGYAVRCTGRRPGVGVEVQDRPVRGMRPLALHAQFALSLPGRPARCTTHVRFARRGVHTVGGLGIRSRYPLGLFWARKDCPVRDEILVHPAEGRPTTRLLDWLRGRSPETHHPRQLWRGDDQLYGVREYRDGDDPRRIHWRTSARRGELAVSEWRAEEGLEVVLVLGRGHGAGPRAQAGFERAVSATATVWRALVRHGLRARLCLSEASEGVNARGHLGLRQGLDRLAAVPAQAGRKPRAALGALAAASGRRTVVYVASGPERGLEASARAAAGRGGNALVLRADRRDLGRWIRGLA